MIDADKRKAIGLMHREGMSLREIGRRLGVHRQTVGEIVAESAGAAPAARKDKIQLDEELLIRLHAECGGYIHRIHERLVEEYRICAGYSTVRRRLRELEIGKPPSRRCDRVPDEPGEEMQHDTSPYTVRLGDKGVRVIASMLYLRYSKRRYLKFYRGFNRFAMKCFLHEALMFWGCCARRCVIDNTNLARLRGTGRNAVMTPEMATFAKLYGFEFQCHEKGHANRKAGEERSFWTLETNFLPGRTFTDLEDLNAQALEWSTVRMDRRPQTKARIIPAMTFEHERPRLIALTPHLPPPYQVHQRQTDQYGYIAFAGNYYWVPGSRRDLVRVLQYADRIRLYVQRELLAEYPSPPDAARNQRFSPPGQPTPRHQPKSRHRPTQDEERHLRSLGPTVDQWLDRALAGKAAARHRFLRDVFALSRRLTPATFLAVIERAQRYQIDDVPTLERIATLVMTQGEPCWVDAHADQDYCRRDAYREGFLTDPPDLSIYDQDPSIETSEPDHE